MLKRTKIVCTIGPSSWDYSTLKELAESGMDVARLNFSHGTFEEKGTQLKLVRKISKELGKSLAVLADMPGPKLRLGLFEGKIEIQKGETIYLSSDPKEGELPVQFDLSPFLKKKQRIFLNDGLVELLVVGVKGKTIETIAQNSGWVSQKKGVNIPDTLLTGAVFTERDREGTEFAIKLNADYVALSFVQQPSDLDDARAIIKKHKSQAKIIVKLETSQAVENLEEIISAADAVMIARGDLAIETNAAEVPIVQQKILNLARQNQKPVIVATQMLESMTENPRPTRAEVSDVANAVLDQADAVMLSAETANGKYPIEAVRVMSEVINSVEANPDYQRYIKINWENLSKAEIHFNAIAASAASLAYRINAACIVVATASGKTARMIASFRPSSRILAATHDEQTRHQLTLIWGVRPSIVKATRTSDEFWKKIIDAVRDSKFAKKGDRIVLVSGTKIGISGDTDTIKVVRL